MGELQCCPVVEFVADEDALNVEVQVRLGVVVHHHVERLGFGDKKQGLEFDCAFGVIMDRFGGIRHVVRDMLVEFGILLVLDLALLAQPDGLLGVDLFFLLLFRPPKPHEDTDGTREQNTLPESKQSASHRSRHVWRCELAVAAEQW